MPKISIILPTYNTEKYIARALDSCINQTLKDIEIVVVDDKGQDRSIEIARDYANRDSRIKIVYNKTNLKTLLAKAEGVKAANSDIIMFLDSDDELELNACEIVYNNFKDHEEVIRFDYALIGFESNFKLKHPKNYEDFRQRTKDLEYFDSLIWNMACKKDLYLRCFEYIKEYGLSDINIIDDVIFVFLIDNHIQYYKKLDIRLYRYYKNEKSITNTKTDESRQIEIQTIDKALGFFDYLANKYPDRFYNDLYITYFTTIGLLGFRRRKEFLKIKYKDNFFKYIYNYFLLKLDTRKFIKRKKTLLNEKRIKDCSNI